MEVACILLNIYYDMLIRVDYIIDQNEDKGDVLSLTPCNMVQDIKKYKSTLKIIIFVSYHKIQRIKMVLTDTNFQHT